jgi:hypothetical protein
MGGEKLGGNRCSLIVDRCLTFSTAFMVVGERNWVGIYGSVSRRVGDCVRSPFLRSSDYVQLCWVGMKGFHVRLVMNAHVSCLSGFMCKMYINLNHRDSRI